MGKVVALISGGIDSPVAVYLTGRFVEVLPMFFDNNPFTGKDALERVLACCKILSKRVGLKFLYVFSHGKNLLEFFNTCNRRFMCVLCKRMMLRVAEKFALEVNASGIVTGDSLGQVASQTLQNLYVEDKVVKIPVLRPLLGFNKDEIVKIAREIGTYETSIRQVASCTANPKHPVTKAVLNMVLKEESKVDVEKLMVETLNSKSKILLE
ncbi:MAG: tRNA sulfurtransferase [Candidatus Bathyarchaeota archaeon]